MHKLFLRFVSFLVLFCFLFTSTIPRSYAGEVVLPPYDHILTSGPAFTPVIIRGMVIHPEDPLKFDFLMDTGTKDLSGKDLRLEAEKSIKYFLASLTVPEDELWVNLSPFEEDRVIPVGLGSTVMGRDLLAEDYVLKQLAASLLYPEKELGRQFWARIYESVNRKLGSAYVNMDEFNRVWIVPSEAQVWEHDGKVMILKSRLKVMLESDYVAQSAIGNGMRDKGVEGPGVDVQQELSKKVLREILIPALEKEVNEGEHFARLRQIYAAMILSAWYKVRLKESLLAKAYADKNKVAGVGFSEGANKEEIYNRYLEAVRKGLFNYIREENDPDTGEVVPRKYFSGGFVGKNIQNILLTGMFVGSLTVLSPEVRAQARDVSNPKGKMVLVSSGVMDVGKDANPVYLAQAGTQGVNGNERLDRNLPPGAVALAVSTQDAEKLKARVDLMLEQPRITMIGLALTATTVYKLWGKYLGAGSKARSAWLEKELAGAEKEEYIGLSYAEAKDESRKEIAQVRSWLAERSGSDFAQASLAAIVPTMTQVVEWYQDLSTTEAIALWAGVGVGALVLTALAVYSYPYLKLNSIKRKMGIDGLLVMLNDYYIYSEIAREMLEKMTRNDKESRYEVGVKALSSARLDSQIWGIKLLADLGDQRAVGPIYRLLQKRDYWHVFKAAREALSKLTANSPEARYEIGLGTLSSHDRDSMVWAVKSLVALGGDRVIGESRLTAEHISFALVSEEKEVQQGARNILEAREQKGDVSSGHYLEAYDALKRILAQNSLEISSYEMLRLIEDAVDWKRNLNSDFNFKYVPATKVTAGSEEVATPAHIEVLRKDGDVDSAQKDLGGIDLDPRKLDLQIKRDGNGVPLPVSAQPWDAINIQGFVPVIYRIEPVNIPLLLGLGSEHETMPTTGANAEGDRDIAVSMATGSTGA